MLGTISFGHYRLDLDQRMLFRGVEPVSLTPRLFDLLLLLATQPGRVISKDEILEKVWGSTVVEDGTITWHLHALRQALANGDEAARYIDTVPKRGYRFVAAAAEPSPAPSPAPPAAARRTGPLWWATAAVAMLLVLAGVYALWPSKSEPVLPYAQRDWLMISTFENQTGEPRFDRALSTALTVSLEQSTFVNVFPASRVTTTLERMRKPAESVVDEALAREICLREGLRALVTPSITRTGKQYALAARLTDPRTGNTVRAYLIHADDENQILGAVQELATRVRSDLGESISHIKARNRPLEQVTTANLIALQQYSDAMEDWARGEMSEARRKLEGAVASDPDFAMAHAGLGRINYGTTRNRRDLGNEYFQRALALSARTTERERQLISADFAASRGQVAEARKLYAAYSAAYPDDLRMHTRMADLLLAAGYFPEAATAYQAALKLDPESTRMNFSLGSALANQGEFKLARQSIEKAIALEPGLTARATFGSTYGTVLFGAGDRAAALAFFQGQWANEATRYRAERSFGLIDMYDGKYVLATRRFQASIIAANHTTDDNLSRARNCGYLAAVLAARGQNAEALRTLDRGIASLDVHGKASIEFRARFVNAYARLGNIPAATRQLDRIAGEADALRPLDHAIVAMSRGEIALASGNAPRALELFRSARSDIGIGLPLLLDAQARAIEASGDTAGAIDAWRELVVMRGRWIAWEAQEPWLMAHLRLARLHHAQSDDAAAAVVLDKLLAIWKDADADLPAVIEARRLKAELKPTTSLAQAKPAG